MHPKMDEDIVYSILKDIVRKDYDGDVLNIISLKDKEMREVFKEVISPEALIIDANTGDINTSLLLERDQILGLNSLLN